MIHMRILSLSALIATSLLLASCQEEETAQAPPPRLVLSEVVRLTAVPVPSLAGTIQPKVQTDLGFRVIGRLVARDVVVGSTVKAGETLAALDPTAFELAVRSARADLASAEATMTNAMAAEERMRALLKTDTETQASVESAEQTREAAQASLVRARTALSKAEEQLTYTQITADYDGVVTSTGAEVGQVVSAGDVVVTVARPDERDAVVDVPDGVPALPSETEFEIRLQIDPNVEAIATVREVAPAADEATRTRRIKLALVNAPDAFRLGSTITVTPIVAVSERLTVPAVAVFRREGAAFVWQIDEAAGTVSARPVVTGETEGSRIVITSGIEPGARIVTAGANSLGDDEKVRLTDDGIKT